MRLDDDSRFLISAARNGVCARARKGALDPRCQAPKSRRDCLQAFCALFDRQVDEVNVDGVARQVAIEEIDGRASLESALSSATNGMTRTSKRTWAA